MYQEGDSPFLSRPSLNGSGGVAHHAFRRCAAAQSKSRDQFRRKQQQEVPKSNLDTIQGMVDIFHTAKEMDSCLQVLFQIYPLSTLKSTTPSDNPFLTRAKQLYQQICAKKTAQRKRFACARKQEIQEGTLSGIEECFKKNPRTPETIEYCIQSLMLAGCECLLLLFAWAS